MSDHESLREAIKAARLYLCGGSSAGYLTWMPQLLAAAESTLPKTKLVEVWRVEFSWKQNCGETHEWHPATETFRNEGAARLYAKNRPPECLARVIGPYQQEVPA